MALQMGDERLERPDGIGRWQLIRLGLEYFNHSQRCTFDVDSLCLTRDGIAI